MHFDIMAMMPFPKYFYFLKINDFTHFTHNEFTQAYLFIFVVLL